MAKFIEWPLRRIIVLILLQVCSCFTFLNAQNSQFNSAIEFADYGPLAFDAIWLIPQSMEFEKTKIEYSTRFSQDPFSNQYFTQFIKGNLQIGHGHSISVRLPIHSYNIKDWYQYDWIQKNKGTEIGDIDIGINVDVLSHILKSDVKEKLKLYLGAELHTAPTGKHNLQFIDAMKMMGTINTVYRIIHTNRTNIVYNNTIGFGGWDDVVPPFQKHVLKFSNYLRFDSKVRNNILCGIGVGNTFLIAEGKTNKGYLNLAEVFIQSSNHFFAIKYGQLNNTIKKDYKVKHIELRYCFIFE